jgi:TonB family protein
MTKPEECTDRVEARPHENRAHVRRKLSPMAYVELGQDNGGIILNLGEGGFAMQSALVLSSRDFPKFRFQVPAFPGWLTAGGRVVWMSDSKKEAGIQFTELPEEARSEIQKWVSAESGLSEEREQISRPSKKNQEPSKQIWETPYRGGRATDEPVIGYAARENGARGERAPERTAPKESVGVAMAEPPQQDFRFAEYSMFAADTGKGAAWTEPERQRGKWRGALLVILLAGLCFALGTIVGRGTVEEWIASLGRWTQSPVLTPRVTPPGPPEQPVAAGTAEEAKSAAGERTAAGDGGDASSGESVNSDTGKAGDEKRDAPPDKAEAAGENSQVVHGGTAGGTVSTSPVPNSNGGRPRQTQNATPRNSREIEAAFGKPTTGHSILVNAPGPGSRPFVVTFPSEAVSASAAIAISARRTLEIQPAAYGRSERVVIGKLISHSEPFYPLEARNRGIQGIVELRARVGRTGEIIGVTPVSGPGLLTSAAATAAREWHYEPTFVDGDPAETVAHITIVFRLP